MPYRLDKLLHVLNTQRGVATSEVARALGVSDRTARRYIVRAKQELADVAELSYAQGRWVLSVRDEDALRRLGRGQKGTGPHTPLPDSPDERSTHLLRDLIARSDWVSIDALASELCVSPRTISDDLRRVRRQAARFGLEIESAPHHGLRMKGPEMGRCLLLAETARSEYLEGADGEAWALAGDMVEEVLRSHHLDLRSDMELRLNLARHLGPLCVRADLGISIDNPLAEDIRNRFPLAWSMASDASRVVERHIKAKVDEAEIGYLTLAFALAMERLDVGAAKGCVLVVSDQQGISTQLLAWRCRQELGAHVERIVSCDATQLANQDLSQVDLILTTVPLGATCDIPTRKISAHFGPEEPQGVIEALEQQRVARLARYFPEGLFFTHLDERLRPPITREAVLDGLIDAVGRRYPLPESFRTSVHQRERMASTAFGNLVAIPHATRAFTPAPFVATGLLDQEVTWGEHSVRVVFLISFAASAKTDWREFNEAVASIASDASAIKRLLERPSYETLQQLLRKQVSQDTRLRPTTH